MTDKIEYGDDGLPILRIDVNAPSPDAGVFALNGEIHTVKSIAIGLLLDWEKADDAERDSPAFRQRILAVAVPSLSSEQIEALSPAEARAIMKIAVDYPGTKRFLDRLFGRRPRDIHDLSDPLS